MAKNARMQNESTPDQPKQETPKPSFNFGRKVTVNPLPQTGGRISRNLTLEQLRKFVEEKQNKKG